MAIGPISGAAQAYQSAYGNVNRFMGFQDPAYALKYKGPKAAAKALKKEEKFGAYPELSRSVGQIGLGLLKDTPEDLYKKFPGLEIYTPEMERFMADPLAEESTRANDAARGNMARFAGRYNLGPEFLSLGMTNLAEGDRARVAGARRQARITRTLGNRENAMRSVGLSEDLFSSRERQFSENQWNYASGMASYAEALQSMNLLDRATAAQNQNAWLQAGGQALSSVISGTGSFMMKP